MRAAGKRPRGLLLRREPVRGVHVTGLLGTLLRRKYRVRWTSSSRLRGRGHRVNGYPQSEGSQAAEEALLDAGGIPPVEGVLAEVAGRGAVFQDVVGDQQDAGGDRHHG